MLRFLSLFALLPWWGANILALGGKLRAGTSLMPPLRRPHGRGWILHRAGLLWLSPPVPHCQATQQLSLVMTATCMGQEARRLTQPAREDDWQGGRAPGQRACGPWQLGQHLLCQPEPLAGLALVWALWCRAVTHGTGMSSGSLLFQQVLLLLAGCLPLVSALTEVLLPSSLPSTHSSHKPYWHPAFVQGP